MNILTRFLQANETERPQILVVGDAMVDEYFYVNVKKISPEFPIPVMHSTSLDPDYSFPGGAANVAYQFRHFNCDVSLAALLNTHARCVCDNFGINTDYSLQINRCRVPIKRRFYCRDYPTYRWDIECEGYNLSDQEISGASHWVGERIANHPARVVIYSDYNKGLMPWNRNDSGRISIVDPKKNIDCWKGCTVFKPNAAEAQELSGKNDSHAQCNYFKERIGCKYVVITQEGNGVVGWGDKGYFEYRPRQKHERAESVIGAGDCFVAFLAMSMAQGFRIEEAVEVAFEAGSLYVRKKHNQPITPRQLWMRDDPIGSKIVPVKEIQDAHGKIVFTNGCFDILHPGHISTLRFAKNKGDKLVVAVNSDESVSRLKPGRPINNLEHRMLMLASLEMVDYVVSFDEDTPERIINEIAPTVLVKGGDYTPDQIVGANVVKETYTAPLVEGVSTTAIINKIT